MICKKCGAEFDDELNLCPECNSPVKDDADSDETSVTETVDEAIGEDVVNDDLLETAEDEAADDQNENSTDTADDAEAEDTESEATDTKSGKAALIIAIIAVALVIIIGTVILFASKKDETGVTAIDKFLFSMKSDDAKHYLDGIWHSGEYYYEFKGDTVKVYNKTKVQQEYNVEYVSKNEIILTCTEDGYNFTQSMKPVVNEKEKTLTFYMYYQTYDVSAEARDNTEMKFEQVDSLPEPFSVEEKMSDKNKQALQGTWKGKEAYGDEKKDSTVTINGETANWQNTDWKVYYASDNELVLMTHFDSYNYDCYVGFDYTLKDDSLKMTMKYQVMDDEKSEIEKDNQTVLTLKKQK